MKEVLFCVLLVGCSAQGNFIRTDPTGYPSKPESYDMPIMSDKPDKPYKEIGRVTVTKQATLTIEEVSEDELIPELKLKGREIGADALIELKFETFTKSAIFSSRNKHALKASAIAIIYTKESHESGSGTVIKNGKVRVILKSSFEIVGTIIQDEGKWIVLKKDDGGIVNIAREDVKEIKAE